MNARIVAVAVCVVLLSNAQGCSKSPAETTKSLAIEESHRIFVLSDDPKVEVGTRKKVEAEIRQITQTEGWTWKSQHTEGLIATGNPSAPFVMTVTVMFAHPTEQHLQRVLTWTWIYADVNWHALALHLSDWDTKQVKPKRFLRDWTIWSGERAR